MRAPTFKLNLLLAAVLAALSTAPAFAEDVSAPKPSDTTAAVLPVVTVVEDADDDVGYAVKQTRTATKTDTALKDVPQAISVVTRAQISDQASQSMGDVVRYVPGMGSAQGEGHRDAPIFRGNTSTSDLFVNGQRDDVQYFRDLYNIERVEVLKGANGMIFGRGGVGGVINRVTRQADWDSVSEVSLNTGSWDHRRLTVDAGKGFNESVAARATGLFEDSGSYRDGVDLQRYGFNPTLALRTGKNTQVTLGYEYFYDERTTDRGVPSFQGRPLDTAHSTFFGDPARSDANVEVNALSMVLDHAFGPSLNLRNSLRLADYSKLYQNVFASSAVSGTGTFGIQAYFSNTDRQNLSNQTDLTWVVDTGPFRHTLLGGVELSRQMTDNLRLSGRFDTNNDGTLETTVTTSVSNPTINEPLVAFVQGGAGDGNNDVDMRVAGVYVQDQIALSPQWDAVLGLRYDHVRVDFLNRRTDAPANPAIESKDDLISPRAGLIYKPLQALSFYASYSLSYLPRAGEQLASLTPSTQAFKPEQFTNYEVGAKWDVRPGMALTLAVYELQRSNVAVPDPANPLNTILEDGQKSKGVELGASGNLTQRWSIAGGYTYQDTELKAGAQRGNALAQTPQHAVSLWNRYDFTAMWGAGIGAYTRSDMFVDTGNSVILDGYTRLDAAVFLKVNPCLRAQLNVENLTDEDYHVNAHNNNNILPGSPVSVKLGVTASF